MKTKEELNALKEEVETLNRKLHELTEEQLEKVSGGGTENAQGDVIGWGLCINPDCSHYDRPSKVIVVGGKYVCHYCHDEVLNGSIDFCSTEN